LEAPGATVTREELRRRVWPEDTFVDFEHGLNAAVTRLRQALGDSLKIRGTLRRFPGTATGSAGSSRGSRSRPWLRGLLRRGG
jgi:hypothetical protein